MNSISFPLSGIYAITNTVNGKKYIGSSANLKKRWVAHKTRLRNGKHHCIKLQRSWDMHGEESFSFGVIELVLEKSLLLHREQFWIDTTSNAKQPMYNICLTAGSSLGVVASGERKEKIRAALAGRKKSQEHIENMRKSAKGKVGRRHTAESIARMTGRCQSPEHIKSRAAGRLGRKVNPEAIKNMSGRKMSDETKAKLLFANTGKKLSPESIAKRTATAKANRLAKLAA